MSEFDEVHAVDGGKRRAVAWASWMGDWFYPEPAVAAVRDVLRAAFDGGSIPVRSSTAVAILAVLEACGWPNIDKDAYVDRLVESTNAAITSLVGALARASADRDGWEKAAAADCALQRRLTYAVKACADARVTWQFHDEDCEHAGMVQEAAYAALDTTGIEGRLADNVKNCECP
ncbi:MAG: hypothetical protein M3Y91_06715 [Actinomycetota bacterium]|nr:hypothetical protein [Actinomycetota bacterium]